jgi:hypothetical protein
MNPAKEVFDTFLQEQKEPGTVSIVIENILAAVATNHHMITGARVVDSWFAGHDEILQIDTHKSSLTPIMTPIMGN